MPSFAYTLDIKECIAPDQNRTDTRSLEGYCSTIELQAQEKDVVCKKSIFFASIFDSKGRMQRAEGRIKAECRGQNNNKNFGKLLLRAKLWYMQA